MWFADIIVDISIDKLDKTFEYILPDELLGTVEIGSQVNVPFGSRMITGYVVNITDEPEFNVARMKPVESVVDRAVSIDSRMIKLAGLAPDKKYKVLYEGADENNNSGSDGGNQVQMLYGDTLMSAGLRMPGMWGDFKSTLIHLVAE